MELRHLRYFIVLAEELHFTRAAERLNIAPPTLSVQIQEIERTLSAQLLVRTKRSVALTSAGRVFLEEARRVIEQFTRAENAGRQAGRGQQGYIEIGYVGSAVYTGILQAQVTQFTQDFPGVRLNMRECVMDKLPKLVAEGEIDVGFVRLPVTLPPSLRQHVLIRDRFCLATQDTFFAEGRADESIEPQELAMASFVVPEQQFGTFQVASRGGFTPHIVSAPGSLLAVLTQVAVGRGVAVIPSALRSVVTIPGVVFHTIAGKPIISDVAAIFRANEAAPSINHFIAQLKKHRAL